MNDISKFKVNKNQDSLEIFEEIKEFIDKYSQQSELSDCLEIFSKITDSPKSVLELKFKKLIYHSFNFPKGNFNCNTNKLNFFLNYFESLAYMILIFLFGKTRKEKKQYDLIIEDIDDHQQVERYKKLISRYKNVLMVCNNSSIYKYLEKFPVSRILSNRQIPNKSFIKKKFFRYINFFTRVLIVSIKMNYNLISIFKTIFLSYIKNYTLHSEHNSNFLLQDRFFKVCPLKNFMFKKNGGKITSCTQIHLAEASISFYIDTDVLFTFGNEHYTKKKFLDFGGKIKNFYPIGSYQMESLFFNKKLKDIKSVQDFDLLVIGINPNIWRYVSNNVHNGFIEYLQWIKKISLKYPNLKIVYKHHTTFVGDPIEENILKDTNIIEIIKPQEGLNSYHYLDKCKVAISFGSTMVIEGISNKKKCFFIDPQENARCFYGGLPNLNKIIISKYEKFEEIILKSVKSDVINSDMKDADTICLDSSNSSDRIFSFLNTQKI